LKLIPAYRSQTGFLSVSTSLFCFLLLGFVFSVRERLAGFLFRRKADGTFGSKWFAYLPPVLILLCLGLIFGYQSLLHASVETAARGVVGRFATTSSILENVDERSIPYGLSLMLLYIGFFLSAEGAFILMATKEYLQDKAGISETALLRGAMAPRHCVLLVQSGDKNAEGAKVSVDETTVGTIPCRTELSSGEHTIVADKFPYQKFSENITIAPTDSIRTVKVVLKGF
jgi:hypothetical protein